MAKIIDGKAHAAELKKSIAKRLAADGGLRPALAVVLVGDNPASLTYIKMKKNACAEVGIGFSLHQLPGDSQVQEVLQVISQLNNDAATTGIIVQLPLPKHLDPHVILPAVDPRKDVDCLHPQNVGLAVTGRGRVLPCTPAGIIKLLHGENIPIKGKHAVIVGRSDIVGKPLSYLLLAQNATVTICHSHTRNLPEVCKTADILVAAVGIARFVTPDMVKQHAVVIDVGINRLNGKLCGDVCFEECLEIASYITPVPGGVGPMTVAVLMENCVAGV